MKSMRKWLVAGLILLVLLAGGGFAARRIMRARQAGAGPELRTAEVASTTAVTTVEASGAVTAQQMGSVFWRTTGIVAAVNVEAGESVKAGDVLMTLDPASAPQSIILAQADLIAAQKALDDLRHPTDLAKANAQKAVADAQEALEKAQRDLRAVQNPVGQHLFDAVADAQLALDTAQANLQLANVDPNIARYNDAVFLTNWYRRRWEEAKAAYEASNGSLELKDAMERAWVDYQSKLNDQLALELRINTDQANKADVAAKAQDKYDTAVANLQAAQRGPDATRLAQAEAKVAVAEAALADAQSKVDKLLNGPDPKDIAAAEARVQAAQATIDSLRLTAPFDGEILVINYQPGDGVTQNQAAVVLADRTRVHVDVSVDETDMGDVKLGDAATITFDALPGVTLEGAVARINPIGQAVQGLIKYTVRVDLERADPSVLLGMTANVSIVTSVREGALIVPLDAVQLDAQGEFVNRVTAGGALERVDIVSGELQGDTVFVTGPLQPGDKVQLVQPAPANRGSPFGPG